MPELHNIPLTYKEGVHSVVDFVRTSTETTRSPLTMTHSIKYLPITFLLGRTGVR